VALADGYRIFLPNVPQKQYHFTNYWYAFEAALHFDPDHPTSLLYEKHGNDYKLIGVMYTAPKNASEEELDRRIPLSIAQWHAHINMCVPPEEKRRELWGPHPKFGLAGSISTKEECEAAGGRFVPQMAGWCMCIRLGRNRKTSGRSSVRCMAIERPEAAAKIREKKRIMVFGEMESLSTRTWRCPSREQTSSMWYPPTISKID
jgi:hypothetical protein